MRCSLLMLMPERKIESQYCEGQFAVDSIPLTSAQLDLPLLILFCAFVLFFWSIYRHVHGFYLSFS